MCEFYTLQSIYNCSISLILDKLENKIDLSLNDKDLKYQYMQDCYKNDALSLRDSRIFIDHQFFQYYIKEQSKIIEELEEHGIFFDKNVNFITLIMIIMAINGNKDCWYLIGERLPSQYLEDLITWYGMTKDIVSYLSYSIPKGVFNSLEDKINDLGLKIKKRSEWPILPEELSYNILRSCEYLPQFLSLRSVNRYFYKTSQQIKPPIKRCDYEYICKTNNKFEKGITKNDEIIGMIKYLVSFSSKPELVTENNIKYIINSIFEESINQYMVTNTLRNLMSVYVNKCNSIKLLIESRELIIYNCHKKKYNETLKQINNFYKGYLDDLIIQ